MAVNYKIPYRRPGQVVHKKDGKSTELAPEGSNIDVWGIFKKKDKVEVPKRRMTKEDQEELDEAVKLLEEGEKKVVKKKMVKKKKVLPKAPSKTKVETAPKKINRSEIKEVLKRGQKQEEPPTQTTLPRSGEGTNFNKQELKKRKVTREGASTPDSNEYLKLLRQAKGEMETQSNWDTLIAGATPIVAGLLAGDIGTGVDVAAEGVLNQYNRSEAEADDYNKRLLGSLAKMAGTKAKSKYSAEEEYYPSSGAAFVAKTGETPGFRQARLEAELNIDEREQTRKELETELGYKVDVAKMEAAMATREFQVLNENYRVKLKEAGANDRQAAKLANLLALKEMGGDQALALQDKESTLAKELLDTKGTQAQTLQDMESTLAKELLDTKGTQARTLQGERLDSVEKIKAAEMELENRRADIEKWKAKLKDENVDLARTQDEARWTGEQNKKEWEAKEKFKRDDRALDLKEREVNIKDFEAFTKRKEALAEKKAKGLELKVSDIRGLRNDYYKSKERGSVRKSSDGVSNMAANLTGHGGQDISFLYDFVRAMDPESVVREGEIRFAQEGLPWGARLKKLWSQAHNAPEGVNILSPHLKNSMMKAAILRHEGTLSSFEKYANQQRKEVAALGVKKKHLNIDPKEFHSSLKKAKDALAKAGGGNIKSFTSGGDTPDLKENDIVETKDGKRYRNLGKGEFEEITDGGG